MSRLRPDIIVADRIFTKNLPDGAGAKTARKTGSAGGLRPAERGASWHGMVTQCARSGPYTRANVSEMETIRQKISALVTKRRKDAQETRFRLVIVAALETPM